MEFFRRWSKKQDHHRLNGPIERRYRCFAQPRCRFKRNILATSALAAHRRYLRHEPPDCPSAADSASLADGAATEKFDADVSYAVTRRERGAERPWRLQATSYREECEVISV